MADRAGESNRRTADSGRVRATLAARLVRSSQARAALGAVARLALLLAVVWAFAGPVNRAAMVAGAASLPPAAAEAASVRQEAGFAVADGPIGTYFAARGGVRTFGPPVSNAFPLLGEQVQIFRDFVLKVDANGNVSTVNLFAMGAIPFRNVGGRIIPDVDQALAASAPAPDAPDYGTRVQELIRANAPDDWQGQPVGFYKAFTGTVQYEDAFPNGGNRALLLGFDQEVWGLPVSGPVQDAQNPDIVLLRWERGVMAWSRQTGTVTAIPLGETFKTVLTGQGLGPERTAAAAGSPFLLQLSADAPDGVARPGELPNTVLANAFQQGSAAISAAQYQYPATATPTSSFGYPTGYQQPYLTPGPATGNYQSSNPTTSYPVTTNQGTYNQGVNSTTSSGTYNQGVSSTTGTVPNQPSGMPGAITGPNAPAGATTGSDPCYGDEQITFAPEVPRVANEVLIAVTSSRPHPYGRLAGTEKTQFMRERPGQLGYVWEWTIAPLTYPGQHEYTFYVDSTIPCKKIQFTVQESLATKTPKPTKVPTPYGYNSNNKNGNGNSNNNDNNTNSGTPPYRDPYQFTYSGDAHNCSFFYSQGEAQRVLRANPSDPNNLDSEDGVTDGIACTTYRGWQYPNDGDYNPVSRTGGTVTPTTTSGQAPRINPSNYLLGYDAYDCNAFQSQYNAQSVLRADPSDPNQLDGNNDGIACTSYYYTQYPNDTDYTPVQRTGATATPTSSSGTAPRINPSNYLLGYDAYDCNAFQSQYNAQSVLRADPSDPNNLDNNFYGTANNGIACETYYYSQYPNDTDYNPVQRTTSTPTVSPTPVGTATFTPTPTNSPTPKPFDPHDYIGQGDAYNCEDFNSQADAQAVLRLDPSDPNKLDTGRASPPQNVPDGIACTSKTDAPAWYDVNSPYFYPFPPPEPKDLTPVPRPTSTPTPTPVPTSRPNRGLPTSVTSPNLFRP